MQLSILTLRYDLITTILKSSTKFSTCQVCGSFYSTMTATACYLQSVQNPNNKIVLPNNRVMAIGRNKRCLIEDPMVSRKHIFIRANYEKREASCVCKGANLSGCDGLALMKDKMYVFPDMARFEIVLGSGPLEYDLIFEPRFDDGDKPAKRLKLEQQDEDEETPSTGANERWEFIDGSLLVYTPPDIKINPREVYKTACFDLDGTLIKTKSGAKFPKDVNDWMLWGKEVQPKLKELHRNGYLLVIFSNQLRLSSYTERIPRFKQKILDILEKLDVPILVHLAIQRDIYRKPAPGMWNHLNRDYKINLKDSYLVGDAAGREKNWAPGKPKDHSTADRLFAINIGLKFYTPEEYFLNARRMPYKMPEFNPSEVVPYAEDVPLSLDEQEVVMMVGSQASGKSTFCKRHILKHGYVYINRDRLHSKERCMKLLEDSLKSKKSVVIDNTNPDVATRKPFIDMCRKYKVNCKCFYINVSLKHAKHNNLFRSYTDKGHDFISDIILNSYGKKFEMPTVNEGFSEVFEFKFNPSFENKEDEKLYKMFLLES